MRTIVGQALNLFAAAILAVGDFGVGGEQQRTTGAAMREWAKQNGADALVTLGDNDYTRNARLFGLAWRRSFGWLPAAGVEVAGALGNHDVELGRGRYQFRTLGMPAPYYVRRVDDVELIVLDSTAITRTQTTWLRRVLARRTGGWRIVAFHHPPFTCGGHRGSRTIQRAWLPLFERGGVRLVLSGHDHNYQRFAPVRGVTYVVAGNGGRGLYPLRPCPRGYPRRFVGREVFGFVSVTTSPSGIVVRAVRRSGVVFDSVTIGSTGAVSPS